MFCLHAAKLPSTVRAFSSVSIPSFPRRHAPCKHLLTPNTGIRLAKRHSSCSSVCQASSSEAARDITECGSLEIQRIKCLSDNYAWLVTSSKTTAIVDPSESGGRQQSGVRKWLQSSDQIDSLGMRGVRTAQVQCCELSRTGHPPPCSPSHPPLVSNPVCSDIQLLPSSMLLINREELFLRRQGLLIEGNAGVCSLTTS